MDSWHERVPEEMWKRVVAEYATPLQVYHTPTLETQARKLHDAFSRHFPGFRNYFAVKALPNPHVLKILVENGYGLDCASIPELTLATSPPVPACPICFTSSYTTVASFRKALSVGATITLDDISLLPNLVAATSLHHPFPHTLFFRLNPGLGRSDSSTSSNVLGGPEAKFGMERSVLVECVKEAVKFGVKEVGLHQMTGSCVLDGGEEGDGEGGGGGYWERVVREMLETVAEVKRVVGVDVKTVNLGGGIGIPYRPEEKEVEVEEVAKRIRKVFDLLVPRLGIHEPKVVMENGRFVTGPCGVVVVRVVNKKSMFGRQYVGVDATMAHAMRPALYNAYHGISIASPRPSKEDKARTQVVDVVGALCENNDFFAKRRPLPALSPGALLLIHNTGAHSHAMGFQYNGSLRAPEVFLHDDHSTTLIRRREDFADYTATLPTSPPPPSSPPLIPLACIGAAFLTLLAAAVVIGVGKREKK